MDDRLKEVHQTDLTEGRINEDFLDWLRTKGVSWLLFVLVLLCAYLGVVRWRNYQANYEAEAWTELANAKLPTALEDVAGKYNDIGAVAELARLQAAKMLLASIQTGKSIGATPEEQKPLTHDERIRNLERADAQYQKVIEADDQSMEKTLLVVAAMTGRAAVAESRGELDQAKKHYADAAARAEKAYPELAELARKRAESVDQQAGAVTLPTTSQISSIQQMNKTELEPATVEPWVTELVYPGVDGEDGEG